MEAKKYILDESYGERQASSTSDRLASPVDVDQQILFSGYANRPQPQVLSPSPFLPTSLYITGEEQYNNNMEDTESKRQIEVLEGKCF